MLELKGKAAADRIKDKCLSLSAERNGALPALAILRVGERAEDIAYEQNVVKRFPSFGLEAKSYRLDARCTDDEFQEVFDFINNDPEIHGILVMRPLPKWIDEAAMLRKLKPEKDLDGITRENIAGVMAGDPTAYSPCTAQAVIELLKQYSIDISGKHAVIIGRSMVVGKPLSMLLLKENATVTICHSKTENLKEITNQADILITAIGKARMIGASYIRKDAVVVDVGINVDENGTLCGDCDYDTIITKASAASPVPGGVGTVTTAVLAMHLAEAWDRQ